MTFLIFSDAHGRTAAMRAALRLHPVLDGVFFLGDGLRELEEVQQESGVPWFTVAGNCDSAYSPLGCARLPEQDLFFEGKHIRLAHGHTLGVKHGLEEARRVCRRQEIDLLCFGHTHTPYLEYCGEEEHPFYLFNPGSIGKPYAGRPSFGVLEVRQEGILLSHGEADGI